MTEAVGSVSTLRDRTRSAMRDQVAAVAIGLFAQHGFDAVTVAQIAAAAGLSQRSFFRYFPAKEDVLMGSLSDAGHRVQTALSARPAREGPWEALRHALQVLIEQPVYPPENLEAIARIILSTPSIRARELEKHQEWEDLLAPGIARRLPEGGSDRATDVDQRARVVVGAALACLRCATTTWLSSQGKVDASTALDELIDTLRTS